MTNSALPQQVRTWIDGMVSGKTTVGVGHRMFSTNENFRTQSFEEGLNLLRTTGEVKKWFDEAADNKLEVKARLDDVREYAADAIREAVIASFDTARYSGD